MSTTGTWRTPGHWWNPISVALIVWSVVGLIIGIKVSVTVSEVDRISHAQCVTANSTADVWNLLITQSITRIQKDPALTGVQKQAQITDLTVIRFPHQEC